MTWNQDYTPPAAQPNSKPLPRLAGETTADNPWPVSLLSEKFHMYDIVVFLQKSLRFVVMAFRHGTPIQCFKGNIGLLHADAFGFCGQTQRLRVQ